MMMLFIVDHIYLGMQQSVVYIYISLIHFFLLRLQSTAVRAGRHVLKYHFSALGSRSEHGTGAAIALANVCLGNGKSKKQ